MLCYRCGSHVQDGAERCWNCGAELKEHKKGASLAELRDKQKTRSRISGVVHKVGDVVASRYKIKDIVGTGGVGVVYRAHDQDIDVDVALKIINAKLLQTPEEKKLFAKEIKIAKKLSHQNIVRIYDEAKDEERAFVTMQFLEGLSLRKIIDLRKEKEQQFRLSEVEPIFNQLCQAVEYAHKSTLHGNLKPDNVLVLPDLLKVTDFGILPGLPRKPFLAIQKSKGVNFRYLAPEVRLEVEELSAAADVYSLGVILTEMLLGVLFDENKPDQVNFSDSGLDSGLVRLIKRALSRNPKERYPTASGFYEDLRRALERGDQPVRPVLHSSQPPPARKSSMPPPAPQSSQMPAASNPSQAPERKESNADEAPTQRLDISKHGARPVEEGTGSYAAIDDSMIEEESRSGSSPEIPLPAEDSSPPTPSVVEVEGEEATEAVEDMVNLDEISNSQIELIADPRATNVYDMNEQGRPKSLRPGTRPPTGSQPVASKLEENVPINVAAAAAVADGDESTRAGRLDVPAPQARTPTGGGAAAVAQTGDLAPKPGLGRGRVPPPTEKLDRSEPAKKNGASAKGMGRARPATRPRMSALPRPPDPVVSDVPTKEPRVTATGLFGKPSDADMRREPTAAKPLVVHGDSITRSDTALRGSRRPLRAERNNMTFVVAAMFGFMVLVLGVVAYGFKTMNDRQAEQVALLQEQIEKQNQLATNAKAKQADATKEAELRAKAVEDASQAEAEAEARAKAQEEARVAALEAARKAEEEKRLPDAEAQRKQADEAARRQAEARSQADAERKRRERELAGQRRAEEIAAREAAAAAAAERRAAQLQRKESAQADREAAAERKAKAEEDRRKREEERRAEAERKKQEERDRAAAEKEKAAAVAAASASDEPKCPKGSVLVPEGAFMMGAPRDDPDRNFGDLPYQSKQVAAFCIDYYESPNSRKKLPQSGVSWSSANKACKARGKRLCTEEEWEKACKGPSGARFPYGNQWDPTKCNTEDEDGNDREVVKPGTFSKCRSRFNAYDMSGNVAEWTASEWAGGGAYVVKGGSADRPYYDGRCAARKKKKASSSVATLGFRCCSDPQ